MLINLMIILGKMLLTIAISLLIVLLSLFYMGLRKYFCVLNGRYWKIIRYIKRAEKRKKIPLVIYKSDNVNCICCAQWDSYKSLIPHETFWRDTRFDSIPIWMRPQITSFVMFDEDAHKLRRLCLLPLAGICPQRADRFGTHCFSPATKRDLLLYLNEPINSKMIESILNGTLKILEPV